MAFLFLPVRTVHTGTTKYYGSNLKSVLFCRRNNVCRISYDLYGTCSVLFWRETISFLVHRAANIATTTTKPILSPARPRNPPRLGLPPNKHKTQTERYCHLCPCRWSGLLVGWLSNNNILIINMPTPSTTSTPRIQISLPRRNLLSSSTEERSNSYHGSEEDEEQEFDMPLPVAASGRNDEPGFTHYDATMPDHPRSPTTTSAAATTTTKASSPTSNLWDGLRNKNMDFPINTECK